MALLRALNPELNAAQLKAILVETAAPGVTNEATPGQPSPLDQSVPIPEGRGAGVLRVDQAALRVVNDLRQSKGEPSPTLDQFLDIGRVGLRATGQGSGGLLELRKYLALEIADNPPCKIPAAKHLCNEFVS